MMRYLLIISSVIILFSFNSSNNQALKNNALVLDFPANSYPDSIVYLGCEDILSKTPESFNFSIYEDTIIDLHHFDDRLNVKLKFNWFYENHWDIGVISIDVIKDNNTISNIDLTEIIELEAFPQKFPERGRYMEPVRDDIGMVDVNFDSYLDIKVRSTCGKACWYSYWTYNHHKEIFELDESLNSMRTYYVDCSNDLIYSYEGGSAWYYDSRAYKVINGKIELFQSVYYEFNTDYNLEIYRDADGSIIFADTTGK